MTPPPDSPQKTAGLVLVLLRNSCARRTMATKHSKMSPPSSRRRPRQGAGGRFSSHHATSMPLRESGSGDASPEDQGRRNMTSRKVRATSAATVLAIAGMSMLSGSVPSIRFVHRVSRSLRGLKGGTTLEIIDRSDLLAIDADNDVSEDTPKPILYGVTNTEGLARQRGTLACYLELAKRTGRELVMMPFRAPTHYNSKALRLEDYISNTTYADDDGVVSTRRWRTANEYDDTSVFAQGGSNAFDSCVVGKINRAGVIFYGPSSSADDSTSTSTSPQIPIRMERSLSVAETVIPPNMYRSLEGKRPSVEDLANQIDAKFGAVGESNDRQQQPACVIAQQMPSCSAESARFEPSALVQRLVDEGLTNVLAKYTADRTTKQSDPFQYNIRAVHLRRGDRCVDNIGSTGSQPDSIPNIVEKYTGNEKDPERKMRNLGVNGRYEDKVFGTVAVRWGPLRCGPVKTLPFLDMCRPPVNTDESASLPLYVATDETDTSFIEDLRAAGCLTFQDLHLDVRKSVQATKSNTDDLSMLEDIDALTFAVEAHLVETATTSYTMGCTSNGIETARYRQIRGLSPVRLYDAEVNDFVEVTEPRRKTFDVKCDV